MNSNNNSSDRGRLPPMFKVFYAGMEKMGNRRGEEILPPSAFGRYGNMKILIWARAL